MELKNRKVYGKLQSLQLKFEDLKSANSWFGAFKLHSATDEEWKKKTTGKWLEMCSSGAALS
jgi:hypothetical protein